MNAATTQVIGEPIKRLQCVKCNTTIDLTPYAGFTEIACPSCGARQTVPMRFGKFLLTRVLGQGGMGAVYEALDQSLGRFVAVKTLKGALRADTRFVENFLREARAAAALNHRNVVQIYESSQYEGMPYIVMELVNGGRLDKQMADTPQLDESHVLRIGLEVAEGLKAAQDIGLLHGDIKPANIMFDRNGVAKVVDFGLARFAGGREVAPGEIWGTPYYIAPEKVQKKKEDFRADLYSLGGTLYHALTGQPPFDGPTATDVVLARLKEPPPRLRELRPDCHPETEEVLLRMLNPSPMLRYPNYASLLPDLQTALTAAEAGPYAPGKRRPKGLGKLLAVLGLVLFLIVGGLIALYAVIRSDARQQEADRLQRQAAEQAAAAEPAADQPEDPAAAPGTEPEPAPAETVPEAPVFPDIAFTPETVTALTTALQPAARGDAATLIRELNAIGNALPEGAPERAWVVVFGAFGAHLAHDARATERFTTPLQSLPDPLPRALTTLATTGNRAAYDAATADRPAWSATLAQLATGIWHFSNGQWDEARASWQPYLADAAAADPAWPYVFQATLRDLLTALTQFDELQAAIAAALDANDPEAARTRLAEYLPTAHPVLQDAARALHKQIRAKENEIAAEAQRQAQAAHAELIQTDLDQLDALRTENLNLLAARDFRQAALNAVGILRRMETDEGREATRLLRTAYDRQDAVLSWLIESVRNQSFSQPSDLGGPVVGAAREGLRVQIGAHGTVLRSWPQISLRAIAQMTEFYAERVPATEQGERFFNLALICAYANSFRPATDYLKRALELNPELAVPARQLLPDLLTP
ncbi:MAG: protein kinase [Candidatus Marinimicrobia bacterium]|nr:protein kinase [Candidatus Neomarinimicrobiota bacterium]